MLRKVAHTFVARGLNAGLNLVMVLLTARYLGAAVRGEISLLVASLNMSLHVVGLAGGAALMYLVPRFSPALLYRITFGWMLLVVGMAYPVLKAFGQDQGLSMGIWWLILLLFNLANVNRYMLLAFRKIELDNRLGIAFGLVQLALLIALLGWGGARNLWLFTQLLLWANGLLLLVSSFFVYKNWPVAPVTTTNGVWKAMFGQGFWAQTANITQFFSYRLSFYLLEDHLGVAAVGIYGVAVSLAEALWIISRSISLVQMSEIANSTDLTQQHKLTAQWSRANFWLTSLALIPLVMLPDAWLTWVFGSQFEGISSVVVFLAPGILALSASNILTHHFAGKGLYKLNAAVSGVTLLILVAVLEPLLDLWGLQGAGLAQSLAYLAGWLFAALVFANGRISELLILLPKRDDLRWFASKVGQLVRDQER